MFFFFLVKDMKDQPRLCLDDKRKAFLGTFKVYFGMIGSIHYYFKYLRYAMWTKRESRWIITWMILHHSFLSNNMFLFKTLESIFFSITSVYIFFLSYIDKFHSSNYCICMCLGYKNSNLNLVDPHVETNRAERRASS